MISFGFSFAQSKCSENSSNLFQTVLTTIKNLVLAPELDYICYPVRAGERDLAKKIYCECLCPFVNMDIISETNLSAILN